eukprot:186544-Pyramimonas_sp.AAC.1
MSDLQSQRSQLSARGSARSAVATGGLSQVVGAAAVKSGGKSKWGLGHDLTSPLLFLLMMLLYHQLVGFW